MGLVCSSLSVWVLWATGNIDRGDIWDWYIVVSCTRELFTISVTTPFRTSKTHDRSVFVIFVVAHIAHECYIVEHQSTFV